MTTATFNRYRKERRKNTKEDGEFDIKYEFDMRPELRGAARHEDDIWYICYLSWYLFYMCANKCFYLLAKEIVNVFLLRDIIVIG